MSKLSAIPARRAVIAGLIGFASVLAFPVHAESTTITLMGYRAGGFQENYIKAVVEPFQRAHPDITVKYYGIQNAAGALGLLRAQKSAPQVDAVISDLSAAKIAKDEGLIAALNPAAVPNYADLQEVGRELGLWAPPVTYDTLALIYNKSLFAEPPKSWSVLWDKKYDRKIVIPAQGGGDIQAIALTLIANRMAGAPDYKKGVKAGIASLVKLAPNVMTWEPKPEQYTLAANGTAALAVGWNARSQIYIDSTGGKIGSVAPDEGTITQVNVISQVAGGKNAAAVQTFINYALSPQAQKAFSELMFYAPTNHKVVVSEQAKARIPLLDHKTMNRLLPVDWLAVAEMRESILEPWRREIIPASR